MLFNSFQFVVFFIVVTSLYFALPYRHRWILLLTASCYFYMAFVPIYILILGFTIVIDYFAGIYIEKYSGKKKKLFLIFSLVANIGVLAVFKYFNFLNENLTLMLHGAGFENPIPYLEILLPIGLSFHTFQAMSYTIEVYRGKQKAERHFGIYSLYVMFYPQLVAGPIERPQNILPQFYRQHDFDYDRVRKGLIRMAWGFFKKLVVADRLAYVVNEIYTDLPADSGGGIYLMATVFFSFQIYCDFSGYSDIALGAAKVMGFDLMENFKRPYIARSIQEFWQRWHISLSSWFKDYLYIPLGGNRVVKWRWYYNLLLTFSLSGLWHGAKWTYIVWGFLHGIYLIIPLLLKIKFNSKWSIPFVFILVTFGWLFFRAESMQDALFIIREIGNGPFSFNFGNHDLFFLTNCIMGVAAIFLLLVGEYVFNRSDSFENTTTSYGWLPRWCIYVGMILLILWFGVFSNNEFIYFQF